MRFPKFTVLGNGLARSDDIKEKCKCSECSNLLDKMHALRNTQYMVSIARLDDDRYLDIFHMVNNRLSTGSIDGSWIIAGQGPAYVKIAALIKQHCAEKSIFLLGELSCDTAQKTLISNSRFVLHSGTVGLHVLNAYRFGKRILLPNDQSLYSVEASLCVEPLDKRYSEASFLNLLHEFWNNPCLNAAGRKVVETNNTLVMAQNFDSFFETKSNTRH